MVLAGAVRTPIGKFGGTLLPLSAVDLGVAAAIAALERAGISPDDVDEVVFGHARQAGAGPNPARQVSMGAGVPESSPAYTVNQACASGLKAVILAAQTVALGGADVMLAGGIESMSNTPYLLPQARFGYRMGNSKVVDGMYRDGFMCPLCGDLMGRTAERLAEKYDIGRQEQDAYAVETQRRAQAAREAGRFEAEIVSVEVPQRKANPLVVDRDEHPRDDVTMEQLAKLPTAFKENGTVHAGNSSGVTDGGAAVVVLSADAAERLAVEPMARLVAATDAGVDPAIMGIGPVPSMQKLLGGLGIGIADIDLIELNEAFAVQVLAVDRELQLDRDKLNVNGGAIALGHPIGCTGTRILVTLLHEMARRGSKRGVVTLCVSGGMGTSLLVERG
ncbi:MAG: acetyl-CoA C-acetyltransferase [Acidobacteria bacterium]|nr:acetyl-CoA C-acetyltransferase [Acidobacteriota bacterium]